ncbi:MAG TPA: prephenate dehydrogenase/arogenate dehydrogenase family protein [Methanothrix sp.]|nr:prephenate dehydrogenase/arogenate dehydrogenase family protein [Methanothrix sp.]HPR65673.1 prephenate dehydrogenase/arogenate dehydrogenase family protein [Methanothrix sp.]
MKTMKTIDLKTKNRMLIVGGTGGTGSWFARYFKDHGFLVSVWGPSGRVDVAERLGVEFAHDLLAEVADSDIVLLSVPIKETAKVVEELAPRMQPGSLLMDVTSLKSEPMRAMMRWAPEGVEVLGTHPMFGPTISTIRGQTVILVPAEGRCDSWLLPMEEIFREDGARVEVLGAEEHDHIMAVVQALTHFAYISIGSTLRSLDFDVAHSRRFMSPVYEIMIDFVGRILAQGPELYASIQENPEAERVRETYIDECKRLAKLANDGDLSGFMDAMRSAADHFEGRDEALARSDRLISLWIEKREEGRRG